MGFFGRLFASKRKKLYYIEIDDEAIDNEISGIIIQISNKIKEFKSTIDKTSITNRENTLQELYQLMISMKGKIEHLESDVQMISSIKVKNAQYFVIKDQQYFEDKKTQLQKIRESMTGFITIVEQRPSAQELREELLEKLIDELNHIIESTKFVIADDKNLREIYRIISEV
ncbi:hypothetical protein JXA48_04405 [Candidatus Woesearchaeota archaeon]|nr:hypothetical protein [Candidatus Woesearchaeota archaeon]